MKHYKPYDAYKDSGVEWLGKIPEGWEVNRLRNFASFKNSNVDKKSYDGQSVVKLCNYTDVYYNELITKDLPLTISTASDSEIEQFSLKKGDIIITKDSGNPMEIGIPALVSEDVCGVVCGYHMTIIRCDNLDTSRLLLRILQSKPTKAYFFIESMGITIYGLSRDAISNVSFCISPTIDRRKIADQIDTQVGLMDSIIEKKTRLIELIKERRSSFITAAVTGKIDITDNSCIDGGES